MKILILMPLDETSEYYSNKLFDSFSDEMKKIVLPVPMFMDYLKQTRIVKNSFEAVFFGLVGARNVVEQEENAIVIGNIDKSIDFDLIFATRDEEDNVMKDSFLEQIKKDVSNVDELKNMVYNTYNEEDTKLYISVQNLVGAASMIEEIYTSKIKEAEELEKLEKEYLELNGQHRFS